MTAETLGTVHRYVKSFPSKCVFLFTFRNNKIHAQLLNILKSFTVIASFNLVRSVDSEANLSKLGQIFFLTILSVSPPTFTCFGRRQLRLHVISLYKKKEMHIGGLVTSLELSCQS